MHMIFAQMGITLIHTFNQKHTELLAAPSTLGHIHIVKPSVYIYTCTQRVRYIGHANKT